MNWQSLNQLVAETLEGELARRRYLKVDPDNRLVADTLEADWNEHLRRLDTPQQEQDRQRKADQGLLTEEARSRILALAADFPRVWNDPRTASVERKRKVARLIEDVTLVKSQHIAIHVRFLGGRTISLNVERPKLMALVRKTRPEVLSRSSISCSTPALLNVDLCTRPARLTPLEKRPFPRNEFSMPT